MDSLKQFVNGNLREASLSLLNEFGMRYAQGAEQAIDARALCGDIRLSKAADAALNTVTETYFIAQIDDRTFQSKPDAVALDKALSVAGGEKYNGLFVFAVEVKPEVSLTRTVAATLTRVFNRIALAQPVILIIRQGHELSLSTCERGEYTQQWRNGEKLGKVSILRAINCKKPHRGHVDILQSINDKTYTSFDELYKHWMEVFSSELLTKKFYGELSDWYAWAVQVVRFPNDLSTTDDDEKYNQESCIRLITRLIFVWFLKQKHLIPEEFFDEQYIRDHFVEGFNPHDRENLFYNSEKSNYYRLILQNLFFAMLNCPIVAEGNDNPNNRAFRSDRQYKFIRDDYNVNNLMRYKSDFKQGGADEFVQMANENVPFLNGGLFDCLDDKPNNLYYDGFSERKESLNQLYIPDWLFFGDEVGRSVDLSQWYGDAKKKKVPARGIINIFEHYNFTIEENTPLDQEVSLDPELLGRAFENLLAAYNPETKTSARKQTGSFYTPRDIVQYMVDESLVAHLKHTCGDDLESEYRKLLNYTDTEIALTEEQRKAVMQAIYNCRVLDPACGSGAFPMGVLQQMVHVLRQLDSTNEMWKELMIDLAVEQSRKAYSDDVEEERKARLADIEEAFNQNVNDPDYARKLYLIEHCIYGVDIQPIAVQISKLRFFISLVVDQKTTNDASNNIGIRPLPNLESKFVAANTLIPVEYDSTFVDNDEDVIRYKGELKELNHKIFLAKRNVDKQRLKKEIKKTRISLAKAIEETRFVGHSQAEQLANWDMFDQNASSSYFNAEWMFGVKEGFDVVIGNPPYVLLQNSSIPKNIQKFYTTHYSSAQYKVDLYHLFMECSCSLCTTGGIITLITPISFLMNEHNDKLRKILYLQTNILWIVRFHIPLFENASVDNAIYIGQKNNIIENIIKVVDVKESIAEIQDPLFFEYNQKDIKAPKFFFEFDNIGVRNNNGSVEKMDKNPLLNTFASAYFGIQTYDRTLYVSDYREDSNYKPVVDGTNVKHYYLMPHVEYVDFTPEAIKSGGNPLVYSKERILVRQIGEYPDGCLCPPYVYTLNTIYNIYLKNNLISIKYLLGVINSKAIQYYWKTVFSDSKNTFPKIKKRPLESLPIVQATSSQQQPIISLVDRILAAKKADPQTDTRELEAKIDKLVYELYGLTEEEIKIIENNF